MKYDYIQNKSWMSGHKASKPYLGGVESFLNFSYSSVPSFGGLIHCPCKECNNCNMFDQRKVKEHWICEGFISNYTTWYLHGEHISHSTHGQIMENDEGGNDDMHGIIHDAFGVPNTDGNDIDASDAYSSDIDGCDTYVGDVDDNSDDELNELKMIQMKSLGKKIRLNKDVEKKLYPSCEKFSKLSFILLLCHIKCLSGWSNKSFTMLLDLLREALSEGNTLPKWFYHTRKIIGDLGLDYEKIHAYPNDYMLYWKKSENKGSCAICGASRWIVPEDYQTNVGTPLSKKKKKNITAKVLRHFPLNPQLQRLFISENIASFMRSHPDSRIKDGLLRHPAVSQAWNFDLQYPSFSSDPYTVRLGLSSDRFNAFRNMSNSHSTWLVILFPYNLLPWMRKKQPNFILSLLILGPLSPGNNIDIYLETLIEELEELWENGVKMNDASTK